MFWLSCRVSSAEGRMSAGCASHPRMLSIAVWRFTHAQSASAVIHYKAAGSSVSFHLQPFWRCWELWDAAAPGLYRLLSPGSSPWRPWSDPRPSFHVSLGCSALLSAEKKDRFSRPLQKGRGEANVSPQHAGCARSRPQRSGVKFGIRGSILKR